MSRFVTSDGVEIRYETRGAGPPVFVCQGGPYNVCDTLIRDLAPLEASNTLVFHDYRGSGSSESAAPATYTFERLADDLDELREHLGYPAVAVLAHSMGGFIGLQHALRHPERCRRVALVGTTPCAAPGPMLVPTLRALGLVRGVRALALVLRFIVCWSWRRPSARRTKAMNAPMSVTQEARREFRARVASAHPELPADNDNAPHLMREIGRFDLRGRLGSISAPALVLYGSRDAVSVSGGQMLRAGLCHATIHVLRDVGHEPFIEAPDAAFDVLRDFLTA